MKILAKTFYGLEAVLAEELKNLGASDIQILTRAVQFEGDEKLLYRANLELRTALRLLVPFRTFKTKHENHFYKKIKGIDWSEFLSLEDTFAIDATTQSKYLDHSKYLSLKAKDAIVDQFREKTGLRPNVNTRSPNLRINVHLSKDNLCTLSLDSSGDSLHKRGYRISSVEAPINEALAAGMILLSGWQKKSNFIDPMCGSGTLPIEAALIAYNIPPQLHRSNFGFKKWKDFDKDLWEDVVQEAREKIIGFEHRILGFDKSFEALRISNHNALAAHMEGKIIFRRQKFEKLDPPSENGFLIMNPPYGERIEQEDINAFYKMIGDRLKQKFSGYEAWIISSNKEALKNIGLRPSRKITLFNAALECKFQKFELYEGTKKRKPCKKN